MHTHIYISLIYEQKIYGICMHECTPVELLYARVSLMGV